MRVSLGLYLVLAASLAAICSENPDNGGVPAHMLVTAEGKSLPTIQAADVMVYQGKTRATLRDWVPLTGDKAGLQLTILIDDGANTNLGGQLGDLKKFIIGLPDSTEIAVAYMRNGSAHMSQTWTTHHTPASLN